MIPDQTDRFVSMTRTVGKRQVYVLHKGMQQDREGTLGIHKKEWVGTKPTETGYVRRRLL